MGKEIEGLQRFFAALPERLKTKQIKTEEKTTLGLHVIDVGSWLFTLDGQGATVEEKPCSAADCWAQMDKDTAERLLRDPGQGTALYFQGRIKVVGKVQLIVILPELFK